MKFASLGSGSAGNATVIADKDNVILVDCGFGARDTERRLQRLGLGGEDVDAILVTHEHGDHIKGVAPLARKYGMPIFMTRGTWHARDYGRIPALQLIENYQPFTVAGFSVKPVAVPHDAREPSQYVVSSNGLCLGVLTDLGSITPHILDAYRHCHGLLVEANHDLRMLAQGPYPPSLQARVSSNWGHLNNAQTAELIASLGCSRLQHLVVGHISQKNNAVSVARAALERVLQDTCIERVHYACQDEGFGWLTLRAELLPERVTAG